MDAKYFIYINAVVFSIIFYNVFYTFQPGLRLSWYLFPYIIILFPVFLKILDERTSIIVGISVLLAFAIAVTNMIYQNTLIGYNIDYSFDLNLF